MQTPEALDLDERPFIRVEDAAIYLGIGRQQAYAAVRSGAIPSIRVGRSWRIPTAALRRLAGLDT